MSLQAGTRIGTYEVNQVARHRSKGEVYRAHDTPLNRDVEIKILPEIYVSFFDVVRLFD